MKLFRSFMVATLIFSSCSFSPTQSPKKIAKPAIQTNKFNFEVNCLAHSKNDITIDVSFNKINKTTSGQFHQKYRKITDVAAESELKINSKLKAQIKFIESGSSKYRLSGTSMHFMIGGNFSKKNQVVDIMEVLRKECDFSGVFEAEENIIGADYGHEYSVASIVGPYISVYQSYQFFKGGVRPTACISIYNRDFSNTPNTDTNEETVASEIGFSLFDISSDEDIFAALKENDFIRNKLGLENLSTAADTDSIHSQLREKLDGDIDINIPKESIEAFSQIAIYDYDEVNNKMDVVLGFDNGCYSSQSFFTKLDLKLSPNPKFAALLKAEIASASAQNRKPYFMRYSQQLK